MNLTLIYFGKVLSFLSKKTNIGGGETWPGHIALILNKNFIKDILKKSNTKIILIAGTNGKTTTAKIIRSILENANKTVFQNSSGANLLNGIASSLIIDSQVNGKINEEYAIFEIDENVLPLILKLFKPNYIICLNLFRDQLDRYGEVNTIAKNWKKAFEELDNSSTLILNADDPAIAYLGKNTKANVKYFGLNNKTLSSYNSTNAADSVYCLDCNTRLNYHEVYFSHLGNWYCQKCLNKRPNINMSNSNVYPLLGIYNRYNTLASYLLTKQIGIPDKVIISSFKKFNPAFGRQETINFKEKKIQIFLAKNPTSFNESLRTINDLNGKNLLLVLNDNIPDGKDVSWIWDINVENLIKNKQNITVSGIRAYDMTLRLKYAGIDNFKLCLDLKSAIFNALNKTEKDKTLYILPTYSAMLDIRKLITGKKIL
jgi:UDP-N-acetylmuramyl tripeptide synthase